MRDLSEEGNFLDAVSEGDFDQLKQIIEGYTFESRRCSQGENQGKSLGNDARGTYSLAQLNVLLEQIRFYEDDLFDGGKQARYVIKADGEVVFGKEGTATQRGIPSHRVLAGSDFAYSSGKIYSSHDDLVNIIDHHSGCFRFGFDTVAPIFYALHKANKLAYPLTLLAVRSDGGRPETKYTLNENQAAQLMQIIEPKLLQEFKTKVAVASEELQTAQAAMPMLATASSQQVAGDHGEWSSSEDEEEKVKPSSHGSFLNKLNRDGQQSLLPGEEVPATRSEKRKFTDPLGRRLVGSGLTFDGAGAAASVQPLIAPIRRLPDQEEYFNMLQGFPAGKAVGQPPRKRRGIAPQRLFGGAAGKTQQGGGQQSGSLLGLLSKK